METLIKEKGLAEIASAEAEALAKNIHDLAIEANLDLAKAAYSESLIPSVRDQIATYQKEIDDRRSKIAEIEKEADQLEAKAGYEKRKETKNLEIEIKKFEAGILKLEERITQSLEKIKAHRYDAQANMHRIEFLKNLQPNALSSQLTQHIKSLEKEESN